MFGSALSFTLVHDIESKALKGLMSSLVRVKMGIAKEREHKTVKLQFHSNRFTLTIPKWIVKKVLCAEHGTVIKIDFRGKQVILEKAD